MSNLTDRIDNQLEFLLKNIAEEEDFQNYKIEKAPGSIKGDGYLGLITAICVNGKTDSGEEKELHLIVKSASKSDAVRVQTPVINMYEREIYLYKTIIPAFSRFEEERNLPPFSSLAKCYKACITKKSEALILENLKQSGYSMWERRIPMEHDHVSLVMAEYGRFHAVSLAMRDQEADIFKKLTDCMYDIITASLKKVDFMKLFKNQCRRALYSLDSIADKKARITFNAFIEGELSEFLKDLPKFLDNYSVILHGDCWTNNMMFKYENKSNPKKPSKMCLIDFQLSRLGSPVFDLSHFFYSCGSKTVLNNYKRYLDVYYDNLSAYLRKLGSNPEEVYPYSIFREQWKTSSRFGLIYSMFLIHVMLSEADEVIDFAEIAESGRSIVDFYEYNIKNLEVYNDRVRHVILHFVNNGFI